VDMRLVTPETRRYIEQMMTQVEAGKISLEEALTSGIKIYEELYEELGRQPIFHKPT